MIMNLIYAQGVPPLPAPVELLELRAVGVALAELGLLAVAGGLLGAWVILRRLAFFTHAAGTATFPGLVVAQASGFSPRLAAVGVALGYAGAVERAAHRGRLQADAATALALVVALAGGTILASDVFESGAVVDRLLFGTIIGLDGGDLLVSGAAAVLAALVTLSLGRAFTAVGFDPESSASLGLPTRRADLLLLATVAAAVVAALPAVGALLVSSIFVVPAAIARLFARSVRGLLQGAVLVAAAQGVLGLYLALWLDVPPGPVVSVLGASAYAACAVAIALVARARPAGPQAAEAPA